MVCAIVMAQYEKPASCGLFVGLVAQRPVWPGWSYNDDIACFVDFEGGYAIELHAFWQADALLITVLLDGNNFHGLMLLCKLSLD